MDVLMEWINQLASCFGLVFLGEMGDKTQLLALVLAVASRLFAVEVNPIVQQISAALPGINCGGCGYAGCSGYADAVATKGADPTLCAL